MQALNRDTLRAQTHVGAIQYKNAEKDHEFKARKDVELKAQKLFEQEFTSVVAEIKRRVAKGYNRSFYPILLWQSYKILWQNTAVTKDGEVWIEGNYKFVKLNIRTVYKIRELNPLKSREGYRDAEIRYDDAEEKHAVIVKLTARRIARELLKQGLDVMYTENSVVEKIGFKSICGTKLPFLTISWK